MLEGSTHESRQWREKVDTWWAEKLNRPGFTPRIALQLVGTDLWRNQFNDGIWLLSFEKKLLLGLTKLLRLKVVQYSVYFF